MKSIAPRTKFWSFMISRVTVWPAGSKVKVVALLSVHDDWLNVRLHSSEVAMSEATSVPQLTPGKTARSRIGALYQYGFFDRRLESLRFESIRESVSGS